MPHNKDLQRKLHETRVKIIKIELKIDDLLEARAKYLKKIKEIDARIDELKKEILSLKKAV